MSDQATCERCAGSGQCPHCDGTGSKELGPGHYQADIKTGKEESPARPSASKQACDQCNGTGTCQRCQGKGNL